MEVNDDGEKANMSVMWELEFGSEERCATRRCAIGNQEEVLLLENIKGGNRDG